VIRIRLVVSFIRSRSLRSLEEYSFYQVVMKTNQLEDSKGGVPSRKDEAIMTSWDVDTPKGLIEIGMTASKTGGTPLVNDSRIIWGRAFRKCK
jgi:hypothetical protein